MASPFDDPEVQAAMAAAGIVHKPGLAAQVLSDLTPLLADEGVDLDNLDGSDLSALNAAFARATRRYNQELAAPAGRGGKRAPKKGKHVSGHPAKRDQSSIDRTVRRDFEAWLRYQPVIAAPSVEDEMAMFDSLIVHARRSRIDPHSPSGVERWVDHVRTFDDDTYPGLVEHALDTLHDYIHFRLDNSAATSAWEEVHDKVEHALHQFHPGIRALTTAIEAADRIDPDERRAVYAGTRVVAMVPRLLEWIGPGRKTAPSGGVRRADIAEAAGMLGVSAVGVNRFPPFQPENQAPFDLDVPSPAPSTIYALSMQDVPLLAAWWHGLLAAQVIETTSTRVRRGPAAEEWLAEPIPPCDTAETVIGIFLSEVLLHDLFHRSFFFEERVVALAIARLIQALAPDEATPVEESVFDQFIEPQVLRKLGELEQAGLLEPGDHGGFVVAPALRGVVARGLIVTATLMEQLNESE